MVNLRTWIPGDRLVECDVCGFDDRFSRVRKGVSGTQKGFNVCPDCFSDKHPNEDWVFKHKPEGVLKEIK